jgi:biotin transport system permease protein
MIWYEPGGTLAHRLDPRSKLAFQFGFAIAAVANWSTVGLAAFFAIGLVALLAARLSPIEALRSYWVVLLVLAIGPIGAGLRLGPPWFALDPAVSSLRSVARVVPILLVSAAFVRSTPIRQTRAAIQWTIPGRAGALLGVGVSLTLRYVPVLRGDVTRVREALAARAGETRSVPERAGRIATLSVRRALDRSDALSLALQARCLSYNPTLPRLAFGWLDLPILSSSVALALTPLL